jgi:hypothetical protein
VGRGELFIVAVKRKVEDNLAILMIYARWIAAILLGLCWLLVAAANAQWLWRKFRRGDSYTASPVALAGGLFAIGTLTVCPWSYPLKWALLVPALLLDFGSGLLIVLSMVALTREALLTSRPSASGAGLNFINRRVARTSWIIKLGGGFLIWFFLVVGAASEPGITGWILVVVVVVYWPLLLVWFWSLRKYPVPEKKP